MRLPRWIEHQVVRPPFDPSAVEALGVESSDHETEVRVLVNVQRQMLAIGVMRFAEVKCRRGERRVRAPEVGAGTESDEPAVGGQRHLPLIVLSVCYNRRDVVQRLSA